MMKRLLSFFCILIVILGIGLAIFSFHFKKQMIQSPIKKLTEERLSTLLGARVTIDEIGFGIIRQVVLRGLRIDGFEDEDQGLVLASADAISFQYNYANLLNHNFKNPHRVTLDSPQILLNRLSFPERLFGKEDTDNQSRRTRFMERGFKLKLKHGRADYPLLGNKYKIGFRDINGIFAPTPGGRIQVQLRAKGAGIFRGNAVIAGEVDPPKSSFDLGIQFKGNGELFLPGFMKLKKIGGTFRLTPEKISFKDVRFSAADLVFNASGEISDYSTEFPKIHLFVQLLSDDFPNSLELHLDFKTERIEGLVKSLGALYPFQGDAFFTENSVRLAGLKLSGGYEFNGDLSISENSYQFSLEKDPFRLNVNFTFDDWDTDLSINLEHFSIHGIDVVTFLKLRLIPVEEFKSGKAWKMKAALRTDYLILDTQPVPDIEGTLFIDHLNLHDISLNWGSQYRVIGNYQLLFPEDNMIALEMDRIDLGQLKQLFFYTRPKEFNGFATGFIKLNGSLKNPLISGDIEVTNGVMSRLKFSSARIKFSGYYPYLRLADSSIIKKGGSLYLEGDLDLKARNVFQNLKVLSEDHIVLWRGVVLSENLQDNLVMIGEKLKRKMTE